MYQKNCTKIVIFQLEGLCLGALDKQDQSRCQISPVIFFCLFLNQFQETYAGACQAEEEYDYSSDFSRSREGQFFTDHSLLGQSFENELEDEWTESYQPSAIEEAHDLGLCGTLKSGAYLDHSLLSSEDKDDTANEWELEEDFSPETHFSRRSTGSYEGDEETSVIDISYHTKKLSTESGIRDQQKVLETCIIHWFVFFIITA